MKRIRLWKGFHDKKLRELIAGAWGHEELLILCPPLLTDFSFLRHLPEGEVETVGDWNAEGREVVAILSRGPRAQVEFPAAPVLGVFTTGTVSGSPRLILYSRNNIESSLGGILDVFERDRIRSIFCYPQPFHTFGLNLGYVLSLMLDVPLASGSGRYSRAFHERWFETSREGTLTLGAPAHFRDLMDYVATCGAKPRASYSSIVGGAKASVALWTAMRDTLGIEMPSIGYGASEAAPGITHLPPGHAPLEDGEIGFPLSCLRNVEIIPKSGVRFSGPNLCLAVVHEGRIEFPSEMLIRDDVERRADGVWVYRGRTDLVLNRGGHKFSLERIEELVQKRLGLEAVCVPIPDARLGEELGILARANGKETPWDEVYRCLFELLGLRLENRYAMQVEEFPLNGSLKLDRKAAGALLVRSVGLKS